MNDRHIRKLENPSLGLGLRLGLSGGSGISIPALDLNFLNGETLDSRITFTRGSAGTRINAAGVIESVGANLPRFDFDPVTLVSRGLWCERQRTNLLLNSTIDGANLATQSVTVSAVPHTLSFYGTGTVTLSGASTAGPAAGSGAFPARREMTFTPTAGSLTLTVAGTVQFANLEAGTFASTFIPTAGSQVTRAAEQPRISGSAFANFYNASEGTFLIEYDAAMRGGGIGDISVLSVTDGSISNRMHPVVDGVNYGFLVIAGTTQANPIAGLTPLGPAKLAGAYKANDFGYAQAGTLAPRDTSGNLPAGIDRMGIGCLWTTGGSELLNGHVRSLRYYPKRFSDEALQALTR